MTSSSRRTLTTLSALLLSSTFASASDKAPAMAPAEKAAASGIAVMKSADVKFAGPTAGGQRVALHGDGSKAEMVSARIKYSKCNVNPSRSFAQDLHVMVVSGSFNVGAGDKLDKAKATSLGAGDYYFIPANTMFFDWASEDTILHVNFVGPRKVTFANPADEEAIKKPEFHKCP